MAIHSCARYLNTHTAAFLKRFKDWYHQQLEVQLDVETNVTDHVREFELKTIQFGDIFGKDQWVIQWSSLTYDQQDELLEIVGDQKVKVIHNAAFEYMVFRNYGIRLQRVYDTMLAEKVLTAGYENTNYALTSLTEQYVDVVLDKSLQMAFGEDNLTDAHMVYAAQDVAYLGTIKRRQIEKAKQLHVENVIALENEAVLAFSDITWEGFTLDTTWWKKNEEEAQVIVNEALANLEAAMRADSKILHKALELQYVAPKDRVVINWNSIKTKTELLALLFPDLTGSSKGVLMGKLKRAQDPMEQMMLQSCIDKDFELVQDFIVEAHKDFLVERELLIPKDTLTINWNSPKQVLPLMQQVSRKIESLGEEVLSKYMAHPFVKAFRQYQEAKKLVSTYGSEFLSKHVEPDGRVRTSFNQIVSTGRVSSSSPNMQNIPANDRVGNKYRNAFVPPKGFVVVDSDFCSQELVVIASISKDRVWMECLRQGQDLHSVAAEVVYGYKWKQATEPGCAYYSRDKPKGKCSCKGHKKMRSAVKSINFG